MVRTFVEKRALGIICLLVCVDASGTVNYVPGICSRYLHIVYNGIDLVSIDEMHGAGQRHRFTLT
jgi:hypothetical protein